MRTILWSTALVLLAGGASAQPVLDERQYVEQVLEGSLEARVAEREAALGRAGRVGAGLWPNPSLSWQREQAGSGGRAGERQDVVLASVPLVLSGRLGLEAEAAGHQVQAAEALLMRARAELRHEATRTFAVLLAAQERRATLEASLATLTRLAEVIAARERAGEAAGYERLRIELEAAAVADAFQGAVLDERQARAQALRLLGPQVAALPTLQGTLGAERPLPEEAVLRAGLETQRADLRALSLEARSMEAALRAAGRSWIPEPTLQGGVQLLDTGQPGAGTGYVVGVALPLPLFDRGQGEAARAEARRALAEARRAALLHAAQSRLSGALEAVSGRRERLARHRAEVLARAEELRRIAMAAYRGGSAELLVLVDAERASREARLTAIELAVAVVEAETDLLLLAGVHDGASPRSATR
jgi:cobalt-zinc-cadmium efflux system outer membrane protein